MADDSHSTTSEIAKGLAVGILESFEPSLVTVRTHLDELIYKQEEVQSNLSAECKKIDQLISDADIQAMMDQVSRDAERLSTITNSFSNIQKHVETLSKRAAKIQEVAEARKASNR